MFPMYKKAISGLNDSAMYNGLPSVLRFFVFFIYQILVILLGPSALLFWFSLAAVINDFPSCCQVRRLRQTHCTVTNVQAYKIREELVKRVEHPATEKPHISPRSRRRS